MRTDKHFLLSAEVEVALWIIVDDHVLQDGRCLEHREIISVRIDNCGDAAAAIDAVISSSAYIAVLRRQHT